MRAFWLIVLVPLATAGYLAVRVSAEDTALHRHELQGLLDGRLDDVRTRPSQAVATLERELAEQLADAPATRDELRALRVPLARQVFRLDRNGKRLYPRDDADASAGEREFLVRTESIWSGRAILDDRGDGDGDTAPPAPPPRHWHRQHDNLFALARRQSHGWLSWYWAEGLQLMFWRRAPDGGVIGAELERIAVLARIVGALPTTELADGRMELADSRGETVHQWGPMLGTTGTPDAVASLEPPLDSWQLRYYISPAQREALTRGVGAGLFLGVGALALALLGLAVYVHREYARRLRDAADRVGFVTRVSHELRTPLMNIRMYGELLEEHAEDDDQLRRARVIVAETQRLGRLIDNVLAFARHQRGTLVAAADRIDVEAAVREAVAKFEPALEARSIAVRLDLAPTPRVRAGVDAFDQIVVNLLSNVEKYAAAGGEVSVSTRQVNGHVVVTVADRGPGVPARERDKIFEPFHRANESLTGASGTGIGLSIARELARAAGGELALVDSERGARFELFLPVAGDEP
ncbi:MAG: HAMP domain-containing histidine kinase [Deltaproteobacteria bacterium]|nr:MAG: HAMP domain-containing histidine kinase [Deltaproteobacteria bacterium]